MINKGRKKRWGTLFLAGVVLMSTFSYTPVKAETLKELQQKKEEAKREKEANERELNEVEGDINSISEEKEAVVEELEELDGLLFDLLLEVDLMKSDIEEKKAAIALAEERYQAAVEREEAQQKAMVKRIKYMYEKGNESYMEVLLESKSMAEAVNRVEYTEKLYSYDRILLEKFQFAKQDVADTHQMLEVDLSELEEMEEDLVTQQEELNELIAQKKETVENFDEQLSRAQSRANEYKSKIKEQSDNLKKINQEEQAKIAEEARQKALEEAMRKAAEAAKKKAEEDAAKEDAASKAFSEAVTTEGKDAKKESDSEKDSTQSKETSSENTTTGTTIKATGSGTGTNIANYALQFVGGPYVSGGTSLTNGCDCSGFTQTVYSDCGIKIPRSSYAQSEGGVAVDYANIQPGDILYYGGHVAIYIGNDKIVHASTPATGIKVSSAFYRSIITIRRYY